VLIQPEIEKTPILIRSQGLDKIEFSIALAYSKKNDIISGYHHSGYIYVVEYYEDKLIYSTLKIPELINEEGKLVEKNVKNIIKTGNESNKIITQDIYKVVKK
jgi:hypothetical protein